jgi:hypothetical protein
MQQRTEVLQDKERFFQVKLLAAITTATKPQLKGKNKVVCFVFMNVIFFLLLFFDIRQGEIFSGK